MGFPCRPKVHLNTDVELVTPAAKPASSAAAELPRLFNFSESQSPPIKLAGNILAAYRSGYLNVINRQVNRLHNIEPNRTYNRLNTRTNFPRFGNMGSKSQWIGRYRARMAVILGVQLLLSVGTFFSIRKHSRPNLDALRRGHEWFSIRDALVLPDGKCCSDASPIDKAWFLLAFNRNSEAARYAQEAVASAAKSGDAFEGHALLSDIYEGQGRYQAALAELVAARATKYESFDEEKTALANQVALLSAISQWPAPVVSARKMSKVPCVMDGHNIWIPVSVQNKPGFYAVDTASSVSTISEVEARRLGLAPVDISDEYRLRDSNGAGLKVRAALVDELVIGEFRLKNVVFQVVSGDPLVSGLSVDHQGLLGMNVLRWFETLRWQQKGSFDIAFPPGPQDLRTANLSFNENSVTASASYRQQRINVLVDTACTRTVLLPRFARDFPNAAKGEPTKGTSTGSAGAVQFDAVLLPRFEFRISGMTATLTNAALVPTDLMPDKPYHVWGGLDVWSHLDQVTLDFRAMRMTFE
jgi:predicted aspartyl protease